MFDSEIYPERNEIETDYIKHFVIPANTNKGHRHPCCELMIINRGEATLLANEKTSKFGEHHISFYPPNLLHKQFTSDKEIYERYRIRFYPEKISLALGGEALDDFLHKFTVKKVSSSDFESILSLTKILHRETEKFGGTATSPLAVSLLHSILLLSSSSNTADENDSDAYVYKAADYIRERCEEKLTVTEIAAQFFVSAGKLNYDFKAYYNMTVLEFLTLSRIEKAKKLLLSGFSVAATASATGFTTPSYFIKVFSLYVGVTPLKFQINNSAKQNEA
jgi:YesN/AraC family two-component response regulator